MLRLTNEMSGVIATTNNLGGKWRENGNGYVGRSDMAEVAEAIDNAGGYYANIIQKAYKDKAKGVYEDETIEVVLLARIAAGLNKKLVYVPADGDVPASVMISNERLISKEIFELAGASTSGGLVIKQPNTQGGITQQQPGQSSTGPVNKTIVEGHINKHKNASSASDKATAIAELETYLRSIGFTAASAEIEAKRYLNI